MAGDSYYNYVSLLLHCDGSNGSTTFADNSPAPKTVTANGNAQISTAQSKFGGASAAFDGNGDYITAPSGSAFNFGTGDFTIEGWFYVPTLPSAYQCLITRQDVGATVQALQIRISTSNKLEAVVRAEGSSTAYTISGTTAISSATWQFFTFTRASGVFNLFLDGVSQGTLTQSLDLTPGTSTPLYIGALDAGSIGAYFNGYIDDIRITKGIARYTADFTPPVEALPNLSNPWDNYYDNVSLLLHCDGSNGSTTFTDNSPSPKTITANGNAQISTAQYAALTGNTSSAYFDGTGDYLTTSNNSGLDFGTGDFTVEAFFYIAADSTANSGNGLRSATIMGYGFQTSSNSDYWLLRIDGDSSTTGTGITFESLVGSTPYDLIYTGTISKNVWHHIAVVRHNGSCAMYLDGASLSLGTNTLTTQVVNGKAGNPLSIGAISATNYESYLNGYLDDIRITKGVARYVADFTPSTEPFPDFSPYSIFGIQAVLSNGVVTPSQIIDVPGLQGSMLSGNANPQSSARIPTVSAITSAGILEFTVHPDFVGVVLQSQKGSLKSNTASPIPGYSVPASPGSIWPSVGIKSTYSIASSRGSLLKSKTVSLDGRTAIAETGQANPKNQIIQAGIAASLSDGGISVSWQKSLTGNNMAASIKPVSYSSSDKQQSLSGQNIPISSGDIYIGADPWYNFIRVFAVDGGTGTTASKVVIVLEDVHPDITVLQLA